MLQLETIAAVATPPFTAAVGIIRMSGLDCFKIAEEVFFPEDGSSFSDAKPRVMTYGRLVSDGILMDRVMAVRFPSPNSYTGENSVEIYCHGGTFLLSSALGVLVRAGARPAEPGEFTKRAFLNGKTDLSGAEAVSDIIAADTGNALFNAAGQLAGRLAGRLKSARDEAVAIAAGFSAWIDFIDEGVEPPDTSESVIRLRELSNELKSLADSYTTGRVVKEGVECAIIGRPNVGKSSLLNLLAGFSRSIVTDIPGTTRDVVEAQVRVGGVMLKLNDTAGIRNTSDLIESLGIKRSRETVGASGLVLAVFDGSRELGKEDELVLDLCRDKTFIAVLNKADLGTLPFEALRLEAPHFVCLSSLTGEGLEELSNMIAALFLKGDMPLDGSVITNSRQADALARAANALASAAQTLKSGFTPDIAQIELFAAVDAIGEITGENASIEVINEIFARFCVGK